MSGRSKKLSNPFSTGGGGAHFEAHVQASFVALMLTGGYAPCLPCWPINEIKLQGKIDGFDTDDLIVFVENSETRQKRKLLGQVKHSVAVTNRNAQFGEFIQAAWNDFNNPKLFSKGKDIIALITGPLSATDEHNVQWLLSQARHTKSVDEFLRRVKRAIFSPPRSSEKLAVIKRHLVAANSGVEVSNDDLYHFLNHFNLLSYDLGKEVGVVLSLIHSHIAQFQQQYPHWVWPRIVDIVQSWNQDAGTIVREKLPEDLTDAFKQKVIKEAPTDLGSALAPAKTDWMHHPDASYLALANLVGAWHEANESDIKVITQMLGITYDAWLQKAREILQHPNSPLTLKNGNWRVSDRFELLNLLGSRIHGQNLDIFETLAVKVLKESDPAFELPSEERYAAGIHGKELDHSHVLRKGIAEGLAILGSQPGACSNCSQGKSEATCLRVVREIFTAADWVIWGSLDGLLPTLAEAAPGKFLDMVEEALRQNPSPFDELFAQEGNGITGRTYLSGLLWALEGLAWDEQYLVRICVILGELASHDPGGQWANRPSNSLATILLPWLPQTLASVKKRKVAVQTLVKEWPNIGWKLLIRLLPGQRQTSSGSHKPIWRNPIPNDREKGVSPEEYWEQVSFYAELAVCEAEHDTEKLSELIDRFDNLPKPAFNQLLEVLSSPEISCLREKDRLLIWDHLAKFTNRHRRVADAKSALPDEAIARIENIADTLAPSDPFNLHQHLFSNRDFELYDEHGSWEEKRKKLDEKRVAAVEEILKAGGIERAIRFAESVRSPHQVGHALGEIPDPMIDQIFLPNFLDPTNNKHSALVSAFIWRRRYNHGWEWCDSIDKSAWDINQTAYFLACLPFTSEAWDRAHRWLGKSQKEYWALTGADPYQTETDLDLAIDKLIQYGRPHAAINCLDKMRHSKQPIKVDQCVRALLAALSSSEPSYAMDVYRIIEIIKFLQSEPSVTQEDLFKVEWAYLPILDRHKGAAPEFLESKLASDPDFFCEVIRLIYRSKREDKPNKETSEESVAIATNAWRLLREWKTPPGTQKDGSFSPDHFNDWLQRTKAICLESGHLEVALIHIGEVLVHSPADPEGLWIHKTIAEALNNPDSEDMRRGYRTREYNARGTYWVDPTGKPEKELAEQFSLKAEEVEDAGFHRLAGMLRSLSDGYKKEAEQIVSEHEQEPL